MLTTSFERIGGCGCCYCTLNRLPVQKEQHKQDFKCTLASVPVSQTTKRFLWSIHAVFRNAPYTFRWLTAADYLKQPVHPWKAMMSQSSEPLRVLWLRGCIPVLWRISEVNWTIWLIALVRPETGVRINEIWNFVNRGHETSAVDHKS